MSERTPALREQLTPNQLDKQRQIIEAAMRVLASQGLAACTVREVAAAGPLTKSAIHYYFADMDVLIDRAMAAHVANFEAALRAAAAAAPDPNASFWSVIDAYIATFRDRPHVARLWLEYWADASRKGRINIIAELNSRITALLAGHLRAAGVPRPADTAHGVFLILAGTILDQPSPAADSQARKHIAALTGLRPPRHARRAAAAPPSRTEPAPQRREQATGSTATAPGELGTKHRQRLPAQRKDRVASSQPPYGRPCAMPGSAASRSGTRPKVPLRRRTLP
jgi:DNA-binding transcriptional regulator YbjK